MNEDEFWRWCYHRKSEFSFNFRLRLAVVLFRLIRSERVQKMARKRSLLRKLCLILSVRLPAVGDNNERERIRKLHNSYLKRMFVILFVVVQHHHHIRYFVIRLRSGLVRGQQIVRSESTLI